MSRLELTTERRRIIDLAAAEWLSAGLSTESADFDTAEAAITSLYERAGRKRPYFVRLSSPLGAELYINLLVRTWPEAAKGGGQLRGQLRGQLGDQLWDQLRDQLGDQLWGQLWDQLRDQLRGQLGDQLWGQLWGQLRDQLGDQLWGQERLRFTGTWWWGSWDAWLCGWLDGGRRVGVIYPGNLGASLDYHCTVARACGAVYPFADLCIVTDRPEVIARDEIGRLHAQDGPALRYRDGYALYAVHGVRVPHDVIEEPASVTVERIDAEPNSEVRRVMVERYGLERYIRESGAELIDEDTDIHGLPRRLWQKGHGENAIVSVEVQNSSLEPDGSRRTYFLMVDADLRPIPDPEDPDDDWGEPQAMTCVNAVASTFGMGGDEYRNAVET